VPPVEELPSIGVIAGTISSTWGNFATHGAIKVYDGNVNTQCLTKKQTGQWVSIELEAGAVEKAIGYVMVRTKTAPTGGFELWLGSSSNDAAYQCGGTHTFSEVAVYCGKTGYNFVTVRHVGDAVYFSIAELEVYEGVLRTIPYPPPPPVSPPSPVTPPPSAPPTTPPVSPPSSPPTSPPVGPPVHPPPGNPPVSPGLAPVPPAATLVPIGIIDARMSGVYQDDIIGNGPANVYDSDLSTAIISSRAEGNWVSVELEAGAAEEAIGYVMVRNRDDAQAYQLGDYEVWLGGSFNQLTYRCGGTHAATEVAVYCGKIGYSFVTLVQLATGSAAGSSRFLAIAELEVYEGEPVADSPPPPSTPPSPPTLPPPVRPSPGNPPAAPGLAPAPPFSALSPIGVIGDGMSSTWGGYAAHGAGKVHDGNVNTQCLSLERSGQWVSIELEAGAVEKTIGYLMVRLKTVPTGEYELWLGSSLNDAAYQCGGTHTFSDEAKSRATYCGASGYNFVTLRHVGAAVYLTIAELEVYEA